MDNITVSEPKEAGLVLIGDLAAITGTFLGTAPIPVEWKTPIVAAAAAIWVSIRAYWYTKINKPTPTTP